MYEQSQAAQREREKLPADAQPFLFSFKCDPTPHDSSSPLLANEDPSASDVLSSETSSPMSASTCPTSPSVSLEESRCSEIDIPDTPVPLTPQRRLSPETRLVPFRMDSPTPCPPETVPTFSFHPYLQFSSIPRPPLLSFPLMNPECFQISDTTSSELDLLLCVLLFLGAVSSHMGANPI